MRRTVGAALFSAGVVAGLAAPGYANADEPVTPGPILAKQASDLGEIIVDARGMTVYAFQGDTPASSGCVEGCLQKWPVVLAPDPLPTHVAGVDGVLGVYLRPDGTRQLTLNSHPLYTFVQDKAVGQHNGVGKELGNSKWGIVQSDGLPRY
ncbi:COG4315 family predicted lipoprotein [Mycolicibacterium houstonense]|uniref:COG4315 family predicted lipoprotein n=1 Tax=Mycolicibacterium houstonense TaxID=146021 RepID=UPI003F9857AB